MNQRPDLGSFLRETQPLLKEYVETRFELFRLYALRLISQAAGYLTWILVSLLLFLLVLIFTGIVLGLWLSELFHSHLMGFGLTTLLLILLFILLAVFRNALFVNPVTQAIIRKTKQDWEEDDEDAEL
jgi:hypothetical protein